MDNIKQALEAFVSWTLFPATLFGAGGAFMRSRRRGQSLPQTITAALGGAVIANVTMPLAHQYSPEEWHYTLFFFVGWGGLELVGLVYALLLALGEYFVKKHFPGVTFRPSGAWDGVERRKDER